MKLRHREADFLRAKAKDAAQNVNRTKKELDEYKDGFDDKTIQKWHDQYPSEEGTRDASGKVQSRYRADLSKGARAAPATRK